MKAAQENHLFPYLYKVSRTYHQRKNNISLKIKKRCNFETRTTIQQKEQPRTPWNVKLLE